MSSPEPTFYLFDGYNLLHASRFADVRELRDRLASFVALHGARGVLVFDGEGADETYGPLQVRFAAHADALLERLAAEHRDTDSVCLVSSDLAVRGTAGQQVRTMSSRLFAKELDETAPVTPPAAIPRGALSDRLDAETRARLERLRRGEN